MQGLGDMEKIKDGIYRLKGEKGAFGPVFIKIENMQVGCAFTKDWRKVKDWQMGIHNHWIVKKKAKDFYSQFTCVYGFNVSLENK